MTGWLRCPGGRPHWGRRGAAGLLPVAVENGRPFVLLCLRSPLTDAGGLWGTAGGAIEPGEDAWGAAVREAAEEILMPAYRRAGRHAASCPHCPWTYETFIVAASALEAAVALSEVTQARWFDADGVLSLPLHPGLAAAWRGGLADAVAAIARYPPPGRATRDSSHASMSASR